MRFFDEETGGKTPKETLVLIGIKDARVIYAALEEFVKKNKRKVTARKLMLELEKKWGIF